MTSRVLSALLLVGAAACAPSAPATRPSPEAEAPPVRALLSEREPLALTSEQVVALDSLSRELDVAVSREMSAIKAPLRLTARKQAPMRLTESHRRAVEAVQHLLRPEQRQRLCELQRARQGKAALRDDKRAVAGRTHTLAGQRRAEAPRTWPWCASDAVRPSVTVQSDS
jgi:hypothetical protein